MSDPKNSESVEDEIDDDPVDNNIEVIEANEDQNDEDDLAEDLVEIEMEDLEKLLEEEDDEENEPVALDEPLVAINKNEGEVYCVSNFKNFFATGGEDDLMYLWKLNENYKETSGDKYELLLKTDKFNDSVTCVSFSCDGKYIAAGDMAGNLRVYLVEDKSLFWSYEVGSDLEVIDWHPSCNVLFCGTSDGQFIMFKLSTNEIKVMYSGDNESLSCFKILKDGKRAVCCYNNGTVRFWDLKTAQTLFNIPSAHEGAILCMDVNQDGNLVASAGTDMKIHLANTNNGKTIVHLDCGSKKEKEVKESMNEDQEPGEENSIESLSFCKTLPILACATLKGEVFTWDLQSQTLRNKIDNKVGFSKLIWNGQEQLYGSTLDGSIELYDGRNLNLIRKIRCFQNEILDFCLNLNLNILFSTSNDAIKLYQIE